MRYTVPAYSQVQGEFSIHPPIVLEICGPGGVVPESVILHRQFGVTLGIAEQEVSEIAPGEGAVEVEGTLGLTEQVLHFFVERPASSDLQLVRASGPGKVVPDLV